MVVRYPLRCSSCGLVTILRLQVSNRSAEPFRFQCQGCTNDIVGVFDTDQRVHRVLGISDLVGATMAESGQGAGAVHTYAPDLALDESQAGLDPKGVVLTPFMAAQARHGVDQLMDRMAWVNTLREQVRAHGADFARLSRNYRDRDWKNFDRGVTPLLPANWVVPSGADDRQRAMRFVMRRVFEPISRGHFYSTRTRRSIDLLDAHFTNRRDAFLKVIDQLDGDGVFDRVQRDAFDVMCRFVGLLEEFRGILAEWNPDDPNAELAAELRVTGEGRYEEIKSLFVDSYEAVARSLTLIAGLANLRDRGNADAFPIHPTLGNKFAPKDLRGFHRQSNAPKLEYLRGDPHFESWILGALSPTIRNAIGHYSAAFDARSATISYIAKQGAPGRETITYAQLLFKTLRLVVVLHEIFLLVMMLRVYAEHRDEAPGELRGRLEGE